MRRGFAIALVSVTLGVVASINVCRAQASIEESVAGTIEGDEAMAAPAKSFPVKRKASRTLQKKAKAEVPPIWQRNGPTIEPHGIDGY